MRSNSKARVAAFAAAALVGGLVSTLGMTSASAAEPTGVTVTPASQTVPVTTGATLNATLTGPSAANAKGVYFRIIGGLNSSASNVGAQCFPTPATTGTCGIPASAVPGNSTIQVYYPLIGTTSDFQTGDPAVTATVTWAGAYTNASITPATAKAATNSSAAFTVKGTDVNGVPASGSLPVTISLTLPNTSPAAVLKFTDPTVTAFPAVSTGPGPNAPVVGATSTTYSTTKSFALGAPLLNSGATDIGVASDTAGAVTVTPGVNSATTNAGTPATLAVSAGNTAGPSQANDNNARTLVLSTPNSSGFAGLSVSEMVTVTNAAGDALGGVRVQARLTAGPNAGATPPLALTPQVTDQFGHATLTYNSGANAGTDNFQAWVEQDSHAPNNVVGPNAGEPQATGTITLAAEPVPLALSHSPVASPAPLSQPSTQVTYTLKGGSANAPIAGLTLDFSINNTSNPTAKAYTVLPASGVTDAAGQVVVTVTDPAPAAGDVIKVNASVRGDASKVDNGVVITYQAATASALSLAPAAQTLTAGSTVTETAKLVDQFQGPVSGSVVNWSVVGRNGPGTNTTASGTCTTSSTGACTFSYTDQGATFTTATAPASDTVSVSSGAIAGSNTATINYVASATTANLTLSSSTSTAGTTANPTATFTPSLVTITATATNNAGIALANKSVTFNSSGAGSFTDSAGNPVGNSVTVNANTAGVATVHVRSTTPGDQIITATSDGVVSSPGSVTVNYTNDYVGITPERVLDTRTGLGSLMTVGGATAPTRIVANTNYVFNINATNLPTNAAAYAFNVTAIHPTQVGNLRIAPTCNTVVGSGVTTPPTSLINYQIGKDVANFVVVPNTSCKQFVIYSASSSVSVAIDAVGYYPNQVEGTPKISTDAPTRVVDTRIGLGGGTGPVLANTSRTFQVAPADSTAGITRSVALNVTAIRPNGVGNMRVYANGVATPNASNVNYIPGVDKSAFVIVNLPANGKIDIYSANATANVAIDLFAIYPTTSNLKTVAPVRILNTRVTGSLAANTPMSFQVTGLAGVPADAQDVLVSVTSIHKATSTGLGNLRVYPTGGAVPNISTLNYVSKTSDVANFAIVKLGTGGKLSLYSVDSPIDVAVDVVGYVPAS